MLPTNWVCCLGAEVYVSYHSYSFLSHLLNNQTRLRLLKCKPFALPIKIGMCTVILSGVFLFPNCFCYAITLWHVHLSRLTVFSLLVLVVMFIFNWVQDEKELAENNSCPVHLKPCVARKEDNYFFALSKYQHKLEDLLARNPDFVRPSHRLNEVRLYSYSFMLLFYLSMTIGSLYINANCGNCGLFMRNIQTYRMIWAQTRKTV